MKELEVFEKPVLKSYLKAQLGAFLEDLLSMRVDNVVSIVLWAYMNWLEQLRLKDVDKFAATHLPKPKGYSYEDYITRRHRRLYMLTYYDELITGTELDRPVRASLSQWRVINNDEMEDIVQRITVWLNNLTANEAFDVALELVLQWADKYNIQMGKRFAHMCGRTDADSYTDENVTMFLRWCFHDSLIDSDRGVPGKMDPWLDETT